MRIAVPRPVRLLLALALSAVVGCGTTDAGGTEPAPTDGTTPRPADRARQVADAWDGSPAAARWREGYHPVAPAVRPPGPGLLRGDADRRAYATGNFTLRGTLPAAPAREGRVTWPGGDALTLPLLNAEQAYRDLDRADAPGRRLTVTGARLGRMTVATGRGPATVPAWLFTLEGYDRPLARAAVQPSEVPASPVGPLGQDVDASVPAPLGGLTGIAGDGRSVTVVAHHGSCDDGPVVTAHETDGSVVLSAAVRNVQDGPCTTELRGERVTVKLRRPVGDRVVLDAFTGRPVPYTEWPGAAPVPN
ncbi:hypothetical protein AB0N88_07085 [Streptomyces sp. NPDC093516]|uniref:hypothetical protein n=1 Tax=Streptomyces sp. NPDC093516 TaxID=3155304 RepID=UPI003423E771